MTEAIKHDHESDLRGMCCAQPIIRLASEFKAMRSGEVLLVLANKSSMLKDVPAFCNQTGNPLLAQENGEDVYRFWIQKA